jgi:hypothetical protein
VRGGMAHPFEVGHLLSRFRRFSVFCHEMKGLEITRAVWRWPEVKMTAPNFGFCIFHSSTKSYTSSVFGVLSPKLGC